VHDILPVRVGVVEASQLVGLGGRVRDQPVGGLHALLLP